MDNPNLWVAKSPTGAFYYSWDRSDTRYSARHERWTYIYEMLEIFRLIEWLTSYSCGDREHGSTSASRTKREPYPYAGSFEFSKGLRS